VDTLSGICIIGKACIHHAPALAYARAPAYPITPAHRRSHPRFLTDASEKFRGDELFCCEGAEAGLYPVSPKRWRHTLLQAEGSAHRGWIARRAEARRTSVFGSTVERGFRFEETPGSLTS
jgi:hypothetical protein